MSTITAGQIATVLLEQRAEATMRAHTQAVSRLTRRLADVLAGSNPQFDREWFYSAAGMPRSGLTSADIQADLRKQMDRETRHEHDSVIGVKVVSEVALGGEDVGEPLGGDARVMLRDELANAVAALEGDSNDAEHDALYGMAATVAGLLGVDFDPDQEQTT